MDSIRVTIHQSLEFTFLFRNQRFGIFCKFLGDQDHGGGARRTITRIRRSNGALRNMAHFNVLFEGQAEHLSMKITDKWGGPVRVNLVGPRLPTEENIYLCSMVCCRRRYELVLSLMAFSLSSTYFFNLERSSRRGDR